MAQRVGKAYSMHVNTTDGNSTEYKFINEPVATFSDGSMTIKTMAGKGVAFVLDNVNNITFSALATAIDGTTTDGSKLSVSASDSEMEICGARPGDKVAVYDAAGKLCASASADGNGRAVIRSEHSCKFHQIHQITHYSRYEKIYNGSLCDCIGSYDARTELSGGSYHKRWRAQGFCNRRCI